MVEQIQEQIGALKKLGLANAADTLEQLLAVYEAALAPLMDDDHEDGLSFPDYLNQLYQACDAVQPTPEDGQK